MKTHTATLISGLLCLVAAGTVNAASGSNWSGCYAGINAGYGRAPISGVDIAINAPIGSATASGGAFGAQLGCDYQSANWVSGAQLMLDKARLTGSHQYLNGTGPSDRVAYEVKSLVVLAGRIGYVLQPDTLAYVTGGGAWAQTNHDDSDPAPLVGVPYTGNRKVTRNGWTIGIGLEQAIRENLSFYVEYKYMDFGRKTVTIAYSDGIVSSYSFKQKVNYLGLGVNYRF